MGSRVRTNVQQSFSLRGWTQKKSVSSLGTIEDPVVMATSSYDVPGLTSSITDRTNEGGSRVVHPVTHTKVDLRCRGFAYGWTLVSTSANGTQTWTRGVHTPPMLTSSTYTDTVSYPDSLWSSGEIWERLSAAMDPAKAGILTSQSVVEATQTVGLFTKPWKMFRSLNRILRSGTLTPKQQKYVRKAMRAPTPVAFGKLAKAASAGWLSWRYGYSQFLRDAQAIANAVPTIRNQLRKEKTAHGQVQRYSVMQQQTAVVTKATIPQSVKMWKHRQYDEVVRTRRYSVRAVVEPPMCSPVYRHIVKFLGLDQITMAAWEVLPFSFVIDWFSPASVLPSMADNWMSGPLACRYHLTAGCVSMKIVTRTCLHVQFAIGTGLNQKTMGPYTAEAKESTTYTRTPWMPDVNSINASSHWSTTQKFDAAALVVTNFNPLHKGASRLL